jgi:hypothetical protein
MPTKQGVLLVGGPLLGPYFLGLVQAGGGLDVEFVAPQLPPALQGLVVHVQGALVPLIAPATLTNGAIVVVLDAGY